MDRDESQEIYAAYRAEMQRDRMPGHVRMGAAVAWVINAAFLALDWALFPSHFSLFFGVRLALAIVLGAIYVRTSFTSPQLSALALCVCLAIGMLTMIYATDGPSSSYYAGLILLVVGMGVLLPLTAWEATAVCAIVSAGFGALPLFATAPVDHAQFGVHAFFLFMASCMGIASCEFLDRLRLKDFQQRRQIEAARDHLKEMDRAKSRFTANVHHELRTPLTLTLAPLEAMMGGEFGEVTELQRGYLKTMHTNALRLLKLINNLLDLAKIEGKQLEVKRRATRLEPLVEGLVDGARPLAERKGIALEARGLAELPEVNVDREAIEKVVVNLLGNALKFTDRGGRIEIAARPEGEGVHLVVADTGLGVPADQLERIFDRFAQVDASTTRRHEGTGIGLALVKELVELHGGRIWAESEGAGRGSQMHVVLPRGEADAEAEEEVVQTSSGAAVSLGGSLAAMESEIDAEDPSRNEALRLVEMERSTQRSEGVEQPQAPPARSPVVAPDAPEVLVVEDNVDMRRLLTFLVGQEFRVRAARNGREGLDQVRTSPPDLILTDVMMPEMSGTELCREVKADPATRGIPVVLVTSKAEREMKIEGLELGADDYVTKPFHPRELMARVRSLVRLRRLQEELAVRNALLESTNEELKSTLAELRDAGARLVQAERLAAVGELAAGVAHEVNNPVNFAANALSTLQSYVDDVRRVVDEVAALQPGDPQRLASQLGKLDDLRRELDFEGLSESLAELIAIVTEGLERTHRLVGDLRDFAAPGESRRIDLDVAKCLRSTVQLLNYAMREAGVEVGLDLPDGLPRIAGDVRALNQVFLNLLKNAAEALEGTGGSVRIAARRDGEAIEVTVHDDGPGIGAEEIAQLFEPFFSTKGAGRGTGLGLSISRRIVVEHGGSIDVESAPGAGTTFTVRLPAGEGAHAA